MVATSPNLKDNIPTLASYHGMLFTRKYNFRVAFQYLKEERNTNTYRSSISHTLLLESTMQFT